MFRRVEKPSKRSYAVLIGVDLSGSTCREDGGHTVNDVLVELAWRQAELLDACGIPFQIVGHTGGWHREGSIPDGFPTGTTTDLYVAKTFAERWDPGAKMATAAFPACSQNLDGQTMQAYIRMLASQRATDRLLLYYTDGAMPAEDATRQERILRSELALAEAWSKRRDHRLTVVGVGYGTDSPTEYGLDTILVDRHEPIATQVAIVVDGLAERIANSIQK